MYLTVTFQNSEKKRYITLPDSLSIAQVEMLCSTISVSPSVDKVWINFKEPGSNAKTNNNPEQS